MQKQTQPKESREQAMAALAMEWVEADGGEGAATGADEAADYRLVAEAIDYLQAHYRAQPTLDELAAHLHISPFHLQRLFKRWAGISPKRFVQYLTVEHAKQLLATSAPLLEASLESGLSGPGRLHDLFITLEAVTPGEYKSGGAGLTISFGCLPSPFGELLLAVTERGICGLTFVDGSREAAVAELQQRWPAARLVEERAAVAPIHARIFAADDASDFGGAPIPLLLKGTNFQIRVWEALLRVPPGAVTTYEDVARAIGAPAASRAVGAAVGANTIGYLIPCHRVIRKSGVVEGYRWGSTRKRAILGWEAAHHETELAA
jgi:AraC family transcriptional regulator of adaptative response/methylated-DNA-[protein]-cysteine methyltransferase